MNISYMNQCEFLNLSQSITHPFIVQACECEYLWNMCYDLLQYTNRVKYYQ